MYEIFRIIEELDSLIRSQWTDFPVDINLATAELRIAKGKVVAAHVILMDGRTDITAYSLNRPAVEPPGV